jgi:hypothetical protein
MRLKVTNPPQRKMLRRLLFFNATSRSGQLTPSFFCRLDDDVVY